MTVPLAGSSGEVPGADPMVLFAERMIALASQYPYVGPEMIGLQVACKFCEASNFAHADDCVWVQACQYGTPTAAYVWWRDRLPLPDRQIMLQRERRGRTWRKVHLDPALDR